MTELSIGNLITLMAVPSAITGFCLWLLERQIKKRDDKQTARENARKQNEIYLIQGVTASIALGEATTRAVQRIPDAKCNGDINAALDYAAKIKHDQKDFLTRKGVDALYD